MPYAEHKAEAAGATDERPRLDVWLWRARFARTRSAAARLVTQGAVRIDGVLVDKPHRHIAPGMVLTLRAGADVRVIRILAPGHRRGPAAEAQQMYQAIAL